MIDRFSRENITLLLAIIGSVGTISNWIFYWITTRKNITISIVGHFWHSNCLLIYAHITNNSRLTIALNDISFVLNTKTISCSPIPTKVFEKVYKRGNEIVDKQTDYSFQMPITLHPLCGTSGYLYFPFEEESVVPAPSSLTFVIHTNRGKVIKKTLPLNEVLQ